MLPDTTEIYHPSFFDRIGLRYTDIIRRSKLGLSDVSWNDLLQPWLIGAFASPEVRDDIEGNANNLIIKLADGESRLQVQSGLVIDETLKEFCYLIDADFFKRPPTTEPNNVFDTLDLLNKQSGRFFRWCIRDRLHDAMQPRSLSSD